MNPPWVNNSKLLQPLMWKRQFKSKTSPMLVISVPDNHKYHNLPLSSRQTCLGCAYQARQPSPSSVSSDVWVCMSNRRTGLPAARDLQRKVDTRLRWGNKRPFHLSISKPVRAGAEIGKTLFKCCVMLVKPPAGFCTRTDLSLLWQGAATTGYLHTCVIVWTMSKDSGNVVRCRLAVSWLFSE